MKNGNETSKQIFAKGENIHVFLYSRQLGNPMSLTENSGTVTGCVLGEEAIKDKKPADGRNMNVEDYFVGRGDFVPDYSSDRDPKSKPVTSEQFAALSIDLYKPEEGLGYPVGSRLLRKNFARTQDTDISVGEVTVTKLGLNFDQLAITFDDYKLFNEIDYMTYELIYHTKYDEEVTTETGGTNTVKKDYEYYLNGSRGVATKDIAQFKEFANNQEGKSQKVTYPLNISSFITSVRNQMGGEGRPNEEDCRLEVILQFFVESEDGPDLPVSFSRASENKEYRQQILIDDDDVTTEGEIFNKKLECNLYFSDAAKAADTDGWIDPDTGQIGWYDKDNGIRYNPNLNTSPLMNLLNNLNNFAGDLLNNLFGGDNNGK